MIFTKHLPKISIKWCILLYRQTSLYVETCLWLQWLKTWKNERSNLTKSGRGALNSFGFLPRSRTPLVLFQGSFKALENFIDLSHRTRVALRFYWVETHVLSILQVKFECLLVLCFPAGCYWWIFVQVLMPVSLCTSRTSATEITSTCLEAAVENSFQLLWELS